MSTERSNPYLIWGLVCAIAVSGLVIAVCLSVANRDTIFDAAAHGTVEDVKYFIERGMPVNAKNHTGSSPLHLAVLNNPNIEVMKYLIDKGANVNAKDKNAETPLHFAAVYPDSNTEVLKYLIDKGADVYAKDNIGRTPLDWAIGKKEMETILREAGGKRGEELP